MEEKKDKKIPYALSIETHIKEKLHRLKPLSSFKRQSQFNKFIVELGMATFEAVKKLEGDQCKNSTS
jgi:hypothetical protein